MMLRGADETINTKERNIKNKMDDGLVENKYNILFFIIHGFHERNGRGTMECVIISIPQNISFSPISSAAFVAIIFDIIQWFRLERLLYGCCLLVGPEMEND